MFRKVGVEVLGLVQNMSVFQCPKCGERTHVFGEEGVRRWGKKEGVEVLADVPLDADVVGDCDGGCPSVVKDQEGRGRVFMDLARRLGRTLGLGSRE